MTDGTMTDNSTSTGETTTTADETAPAPKLAGDIPRSRPDLIDTDVDQGM